MSKTEVPTAQIREEGVRRGDLNSTTSGQAVNKKIILGDPPGGVTIQSTVADGGMVMRSTGVDPGTGDVYLRQLDRIIIQGVNNGTATANWFRLGDNSLPSSNGPFIVDKEYYLKKLIYKNNNQGGGGDRTEITCRSIALTDAGNVGTGDPLVWEVDTIADAADLQKNLFNGARFVYIAPDKTKIIGPNLMYAFRFQTFGWTPNNSYVWMEFEELIS